MADKTYGEVAAKAAPGVLVVQGIEVEGVTRETLDDFEFMEVIAIMGDPDADGDDRLRAIASVAPIVFGKAQWKRIKAELRDRNGGKLPVDAAMGFINETVLALNAKNY